MPFINVMVSTDVSEEQAAAVKTKLGEAISLFPGKSESYFMVRITPCCRLYFGGDDSQPIAYGEFKLLGDSTREYYEKFTAAFCKIMEEELKIPQNRTYINYQGFEHWGYDGYNF